MSSRTTRSVDTKLTYSCERRNYIRNSSENENVQSFDFGTQIRPIKDLLYLDEGTLQAATQVDSRRASGFNNSCSTTEPGNEDSPEEFGGTQGGVTFTRRFIK